MTLPASELLEGITLDILARIIDTNPGFASPMFGYVAEYWLGQELLRTPGVTQVEKIPDHSRQKGDFSILYEGRPYVLESKCARSGYVRKDRAHGDIGGSVHLGGTDAVEVDGVRTKSIERGRYDVLAICLKPVTGSWDFAFIHNKYLPRSESYPERVGTSLTFTLGVTPFLFSELSRALA